MTKPQDMSNKQLNISLEVLLGAIEDRYREGQVLKGTYSVSPKNYAENPANSLMIQERAIAKNGLEYLAHLSEVIEPDEPGYQQEGELIAYTLEHTINLLVATPRQRAEAAYMTLSREV
ncbi:hypothetical protein [Paenibacillus senegalimassiliensis]|uniref:hypothetical protein n=1 Tax=Paenibacillus senegalimassiliensis TaxID=1737426 RepID=UPI00073E658E|nr:hypothetical protein [Paenibacillus senegalimassiliensis]